MADPGQVFRRAFAWLPAQFASQSDAGAPIGVPRRFGSTEHLSIEAIAAFVDGELRMNAHLRAAHHLSLCAQCEAEVDGHSRARDALRDSQPIRIPSSLLGSLEQIPQIPQIPQSLPQDLTQQPAGSSLPGVFGEDDRRDQRKRR
ncbi:anti-sigma E factor RseA [Mycobacterium sp.]|uniref:anti-sigma E factor RseA n=1 Tax=Mycobacterium sp. TaxID=1785 RepID=UPI003A8C892A